MFRKLISTALITGLTAIPAQAALITQIQEDLTSPFEFTAFDPSLGILRGVNIDSSLSASFSGQNPLNQCQELDNCAGTIYLSWQSSSTGALSGRSSTTRRFVSNTAVDTGFSYTLNQNTGGSFTNLTDFYAPNNLGDITVNAFVDGDLGDWLAPGFPTQPMGRITLTYTYDEINSVPAPTSLALMSLCLLGLGIRRRRQLRH
jgi:hypothetical protein